MDAALKVTFTELCEYASYFIWSTEAKTRSKFDSLGILREGNVFVIIFTGKFGFLSLACRTHCKNCGLSKGRKSILNS